MPNTSQIDIRVSLDDNKVPENIIWRATDSDSDADNNANAMFLSFWDNTDKNALRIDLWTKEMTVEEMADFTYQAMMGISETYKRATKDDELSDGIKKFAEDFLKRFNEKQHPNTPANK